MNRSGIVQSNRVIQSYLVLRGFCTEPVEPDTAVRCCAEALLKARF